MSNPIKSLFVLSALMALGAATAAAQTNHAPPPAAAEPATPLMVGARDMPPGFAETLMASLAEHSRLVQQLPEDIRNRPYRSCSEPEEMGLRSGGTTFAGSRWLNKVVPYDFDAALVGNFVLQGILTNAMDVIESVCDVDFVPRNGQSAYIRFYPSDVNSSPVGAGYQWCPLPQGTDGLDAGEPWQQVNENSINIYNFNVQGVVIHEIMHSLGFNHTQSRRDRLLHLRYNSVNVEAGQEHNFEIRQESSVILPYDFFSLMHYGACDFSICSACGACFGLPDQGLVLVANDPDNQSLMGNRAFMSVGDIYALNAQYGSTDGISIDVPEAAQALNLGGSASGNLDGAAVTFVTGSANGDPLSPDDYLPAAAWYRVNGTGTTFRAALISAAAGVRRINVYEVAAPGCGIPLNLAALGREFDSHSSSVVWQTTAGQTYLIAIEGYDLFFNNPDPTSYTVGLTDLGSNGNDACANAVTLAPTVTGLTPPQPPIAGNLTNASNDGQTNCAAAIDINDPRGDVWYRYVVPYSGQLNLLIDTTANGPNTILSVHSGCPGTPANQLACNASRGTFQEDAEITMNVFAGQTLYVRVSWEWTFGAANSGLRDGTFELSSTLTVSPPANSNCASATTIAPGTPLNQNMFGAAATGSASCAGFPNAVYYQYTAPAAATLRLSASPLNGSLPPYLSIHTAACPATTATQLACGYGQVSAALAAGQTVRIRAAGTWNTQFTLNSTFAPDNDACADAIQAYPDSTFQGTLIGATGDGQQNCTTSPNGDVWYRFTAPADGALFADTIGTRAAGGPDTVLSAYEGCPGTSANILACNDDWNQTLDSRVSVAMTQGQEVRIRVGYYDAAIHDGEFTLHTTFVNVVRFTRLDPSPTSEQFVRFKADFGAPVSGFQDNLDVATTETATLSGSVFTRIDPSVGMHFSGAADNEIVTASNPAFNIQAGLTVEAWVRPGSTASFQQVLSTNAPRNAGIRWGILADGRIDFTTLGVQNYFTTQARVADNVWTHIAIVFDTGGEAHYYVNGQFAETVNGSSFIINNPGAQVLIGGDPSGNQFNGKLDEVRLWNVQRTPADIAANMHARLLGYETGLIGYWKLDTFEDLGVGAAGVNDVRDSSPTAAHGGAGAVTLDEGRPAGPYLRFRRDSGSRGVALNNAAYSMPNTFTVEARVRALDLHNGTTRHAFFGADNSVPPAGGIQVGRETNGNLLFTAFGVADLSVASQPFTPGQWVHIAVSVDASRVVRYYVNGSQVGSHTLAENVRPWVSNLHIGQSSSGARWDGDIDEVRYWSVVRSAAEILANKDRQLVGTESGLIGHWTLNALEDLGFASSGRNDLVDSSPLGNRADSTDIFEGPVSEYFVTVHTGTGSGELGLDLLPGATLTDATGAPRALVGDVTETYIIDRPDLCPADYDGNGTLGVPDIFEFLTDWFAGVPAAYEFGGTAGVPAIFAFLSAWFAGCP